MKYLMANSIGFNNWGDDVCDYIVKDMILREDPEAYFWNQRALSRKDPEDFDAFIIAGGGLFYKSSAPGYAEMIKTMKDAGRKVIVFCIGVQTPIKNKDFAEQLNRCDYISTRFPGNVRLLRKAGVTAKIDVAADPLWLFPQVGTSKGGRGVLISSMKRDLKFRDEMQKLIKMLSEEYPITCWNMELPDNWIEDIASEVPMKIIDYTSPYTISYYDASRHEEYRETFEEWSRSMLGFDICVSLKLHVLLEQAKMGVQTYTVNTDRFGKLWRWRTEEGFPGRDFDQATAELMKLDIDTLLEYKNYAQITAMKKLDYAKDRVNASFEKVKGILWES